METLQFVVEHIGLASPDTGRLANWYVATLGGRIIFQTDTQPTAYFVELPGGLIVEIYAAAQKVAETGINSTAGWRHLALQVESLPTARAILTGKGVAFPDPVKPAGGSGQVLFFADPDGNLLHLVERPPGSLFRKSP